MKRILYVDSCLHRESSRTEALAQALLGHLRADDVEIEELILENEHLVPLDGEMLGIRAAGTAAGDYNHPVFSYARQFADMDEVVIAAPYWDFSFPSMLKVYLEMLCAQGVTFTYSELGVPAGLVKVKRVWYVTTVGGYSGEWDYGLDQIKAICTLFFGIEDVRCFRAEGLDIATNDVSAIMADAIAQIEAADLS